VVKSNGEKILKKWERKWSLKAAAADKAKFSLTRKIKQQQ